jgi:hypothetical protein
MCRLACRIGLAAQARDLRVQGKGWMLTTNDKNSPTFKGLVLEQNDEWRYYFWYPKGWYRYDLSASRHGVLCSPQSEAPTTFFSVEAAQLETDVRSSDLTILREGVEEGLHQLPGLQVESANESAIADRVTLERTYTFVDGEVTRKRRVRLIYDRNKLYSLMSQGATPDEYEHWLSMLNYCHLTFQIGLFDLASIGSDARADT